jgi:general secretion pathway protein C
MGLFGGTPSAAPSAATAGNAIRLAGVVAAEEGRDAYAVLVLDGKEIVVTLRGEEITQGIRLAEVAPGHVVLERHGVRETLVLPERGGAAENASPRKDR